MPLYNDQFVDILHQTILHTVRRDGPDLSSRQMALLLITALEEGMHTVRGLAQRLDISKPAITRSLDRLQYLGLSERKPDPRDGRSVLVVPTEAGYEYIAMVKEQMGIVAEALVSQPETKARKPRSLKVA